MAVASVLAREVQNSDQVKAILFWADVQIFRSIEGERGQDHAGAFCVLLPPHLAPPSPAGLFFDRWISESFPLHKELPLFRRKQYQPLVRGH